MSSVKAHLGMIVLDLVALARDHLTEADEFEALDKIERDVHGARQVFERHGKIKDEEQPTIQEAETESP